MNVLVLIMSANNYLSHKNIDAMRETWIDTALHGNTSNHFTVADYEGGFEDQQLLHYDDGMLHLQCVSEDDIHHTYEKTIEAFNYFLNNNDFDILIRTNISNYVNINMIDKILNQIDPKCVYANKFPTILSDMGLANDIFPRGDFYITGRENIKGIVDNCKNIPPMAIYDHVDDVMVGIALKEYKGKHYFRDYKSLYYAFLPMPVENLMQDATLKTRQYISYRVKTMPPNERVSGYSWDYNEYREHDSLKIKEIHKLLSTNKMEIPRYVMNDENISGVTVVQYANATMSDVKGFLNKKAAMN